MKRAAAIWAAPLIWLARMGTLRPGTVDESAALVWFAVALLPLVALMFVEIYRMFRIEIAKRAAE